MKITKLLKRHHAGCFDVEFEDGSRAMVQLANKLEDAWHARIAEMEIERTVRIHKNDRGEVFYSKGTGEDRIYSFTANFEDTWDHADEVSCGTMVEG